MRTSRLPLVFRFRLPGYLAALFVACLLFPSNVAATSEKKSVSSGPRVTLEVYGTVTTRDGQRLRLVTDLGNVVIRTQNSGKLDYHVHLEADASQKNPNELLKSYSVNAREASEGVYFRGQTFGRQLRGRLWVTVEINVPRNYGLDVWTGGGNIETEDAKGRVVLSTA